MHRGAAWLWQTSTCVPRAESALPPRWHEGRQEGRNDRWLKTVPGLDRRLPFKHCQIKLSPLFKIKSPRIFPTIYPHPQFIHQLVSQTPFRLHVHSSLETTHFSREFFQKNSWACCFLLGFSQTIWSLLPLLLSKSFLLRKYNADENHHMFADLSRILPVRFKYPVVWSFTHSTDPCKQRRLHSHHYKRQCVSTVWYEMNDRENMTKIFQLRDLVSKR